MTNNYVNKLSYMSLPIVQNKVLGGGYYLLTNLKVNIFCRNKMDRMSLPIFCYVIKGGIIYAEKTNNISGC